MTAFRTKNNELTEAALNMGWRQQALTGNENFRVTLHKDDSRFWLTVTDLSQNSTINCEAFTFLTDARRSFRHALKHFNTNSPDLSQPAPYISRRSLVHLMAD